MTKTIAILASDVHLSHQAPVARSAEPDWYSAMQRPLDEIKSLAAKYECPVVIAGDIFDRWNSSAESINWAIDHLPPCYAVPGQHDLPNHDLNAIERSAYWTLVKADVVKHIGHDQIGPDDAVPFCLFGFPWNCSLHTPGEWQDTKWLCLAVIHKYIYTNPKNCYPGAPPTAMLSGLRDKLAGYDAAVFGDNHKGFIAKAGKCNVINGGTLMRRKSDERDYKPHVGLLQSNGTIIEHFLDCSQDKWLDDVIEAEGEELPNMNEFIAELESLQADSLNYRDAIKQYKERNKLPQRVEQILDEVVV